MFDIILQRNNSPRNKLDKDISNIATLSGSLRDGCSITDPVILVQAAANVISRANYATISVFGRSYYITNVKTAENGLFEITAHVDVLTTYKTQIRANDAIIKRSENNWNLYLNDGSFKIYQNPYIITKTFPNGFQGQNFILAVAGG